jgi:TolB protein
MTFQPRFERDVPVLLEELYLAGTPDYRDDLLLRIVRTRQRPAWSFPTRWIPMDIVTRRVPFAPLPWRALGILALIVIAAAAVVLVGVGSPQRVPPPFGPARNGPLAYTQNDAIYTRDSIAGAEKLLVGGDGLKYGFWGFSPDGTRMLYQKTVDGSDYLIAADADGRNARQILDAPVKDTYVAWGPDGRTVAVATEIDAIPSLLFAHVDGSPPVRVDLGGIKPTDLAWRPPTGAQLLFRGQSFPSASQDLYLVNADGTGLRGLGLPSPLIFGPDWDVSGPSWSPSGDRIAYNRVEFVTGDLSHFRVHVVRPDGTGDVALPAPEDPAINEAWPIWSPDGRWIAVEHFTFGEPGDDWAALLPSDGSAPARDLLPRRRASPDGGIVKTWSPDGTRVFARSNGFGTMFSIDPVTGVIEDIPWRALDLPDIRRLAP